jgi:wobble nucleotide-excising tRNase
MFLRKITKIENVGRFHRGGVSGGEYKKFTLFYAGNGRGKTTVCSILRSLQRNDPVCIQERKTLWDDGDPTVQLLFDHGSVNFKKGAWGAHHDKLHIFDGHFVAENVHGGEHVDTEHRRKFYRVVVGPVGVAYANAVDRLDAQIIAKNSEINSARKALQAYVPQGKTVDKYIALPVDPEIDNKIEDANAALRAAQQAGEIAKRIPPSRVDVPILSAMFDEVIGQTLEIISAEAARNVQDHLARHKMHEHGETWLSRGLESILGEVCPFCGQDLKTSTLVEAYNQYFSGAYQEFRSKLAETKEIIAKTLADGIAHKLCRVLDQHAAEIAFWRQFGEIDYTPVAAIDQIPEQIALLKEAALNQIDRKLAAPLDLLAADPALEDARATWQVMVSALNEYNIHLAKVAVRIAEIKAANSQRDRAAVEQTVHALNIVKSRHREPVATLAKNYLELVAEKEKLSEDKDAAKANLDRYDGEVIAKYEASINKYLRLFGANFKLGKCGKTYVGGVPQSVYCLEINGEYIDVAAKEQPGKPTFRTAMSAGDKSTLALAFFLAQLEQDQGIADKIIVFDDPFTSLDEFRREMTAKSIQRVGGGASQVIVLSHDKHFLDCLYQKVKGADCATFQLSSPNSKNTIIDEWWIEREVKEGYLQDHMRLFEFTNNNIGDARDMRTAMRPLLEKYIRYRFPNSIPDGKWLGDMLAVIRNDPNHPLAGVYATIDDINQYTAPFHHDPNTPFTDAEVRTYVERTLLVVGGC